MRYKIFQVNREYFRDVAFEAYETVKKRVGEPKKEWYHLVYEFDGDGLGLDDVFREFNINLPADFEGHSMSTSDVVWNGDGYWYCDSFGWKRLDWDLEWKLKYHDGYYAAGNDIPFDESRGEAWVEGYKDGLCAIYGGEY